MGSSFCPPKYVDVKTDSAGYIVRNQLVSGCAFQIYFFDEQRELVEGDVVHLFLRAPGYENTSAEIRIDKLFEEEPYFLRTYFSPLKLDGGNNSNAAEIAAGMLAVFLCIAIIMLITTNSANCKAKGC